MTRTLQTGILVLACAAALPAFAQGAPEASDLIDAAIEAHGGRAAIEAYPSLEMKGTVEMFGRFSGSRSDMILRERGDGAYRREVVFEFRGNKLNVVEFYDGEVRKRRFRTSWDDLPTDEADEGAAHRLGFLLSLDRSAAKVDGDGTEADVPVWYVSVPDGRDSAVLAFAKDDGRMMAIEYPGTSAAGMGTKEDVQRKLIYRDHRTVGDLTLPFDVEVLEDSSPTSRMRYDTIDVLDAFDRAWVKLPDPTRRFIPSEEMAF